MDYIKWSLIIGAAVLVLRFGIAFIRKASSGKPITSLMIVTFVLTAVSAGMAMFLAGSIKSTIDERKLIGDREAAVIEHLSLIREAELVFQEIYGHYTTDWDSLRDFINNGEYPIIQRTEEIITLDYGADSIILHIDTIGTIPAWERIFRANYTENAVDTGTVQEYFQPEGGTAVKGAKAYVLVDDEGVVIERDFMNNGKISAYEVKEGQMANKGDVLISYWEYRFDPDINIDQLGYVPGRENVKFEIFTSKIPMGASGLLVDVIEVKNPLPFDPNRKESNEAKNLRPLRFGSRTDATTSGNWE